MAFFNKTFTYKVYDSAGNYLATWKDEVLDDPSFRTIINGGAGELVFRLARPIDNFGEGEDVAFNNRIKLYIKDIDVPVTHDTLWDSAIWDTDYWDENPSRNGVLQYDGFISNYELVVDGKTECIRITCLSYTTTLPEILIRDGTGDTAATTITYTNDDPGTIFRDVLDKYVAQGGNLVAGDIDTTGDLVPSFTFQINNTLEGFQECVKLAPVGWFWRVNPNSSVDFKAQSIEPDHKLFLGPQVQVLNAVKRMEGVKNVVYFVGGDMGGGSILYKIYKRATSITAFGRREYIMQDQRVIDTSTAQLIANNYLDKHDTFEVRTTIKVMDNNGANSKLGYNIESLKAGDIVRIFNADQSYETLWDEAVWDGDYWDYNPAYALRLPMQIQSVLYNFDSATLELSTRIPQVSRRLQDLSKNLQQTINVTAPTNPTP